MEKQDFDKAISQLPEEFQQLLLDKVKSNKNYISSLIDTFNVFKKEVKFKVGDLVVWKHGLKNRKFPDYNKPLIVIEILEDSVFDSKEGNAGSPLFREPLNIILGTVDEDDGDLLTYHFDKRRFEIYENM